MDGKGGDIIRREHQNLMFRFSDGDQIEVTEEADLRLLAAVIHSNSSQGSFCG